MLLKDVVIAEFQVVPASEIPDGWMGLDIGPDSIKSFSETLDTTKTVIWNGPMGVFEFEKFAAGTEVCYFVCWFLKFSKIFTILCICNVLNIRAIKEVSIFWLRVKCTDSPP